MAALNALCTSLHVHHETNAANSSVEDCGFADRGTARGSRRLRPRPSTGCAGPSCAGSPQGRSTHSPGAQRWRGGESGYGELPKESSRQGRQSSQGRQGGHRSQGLGCPAAKDRAHGLADLQGARAEEHVRDPSSPSEARKKLTHRESGSSGDPSRSLILRGEISPGTEEDPEVLDRRILTAT